MCSSNKQFITLFKNKKYMFFNLKNYFSWKFSFHFPIFCTLNRWYTSGENHFYHGATKELLMALM